MAEHHNYKVRLDCQHVIDWKETVKPHGGEEVWCERCRAHGRVLAVYAVTRHVESEDDLA